ncbi:hypothetical protein [Vulcanococcus sp.]|uniref:hypothetical protein n=1 Tax=Vulcanococcus sp. TaxID=2856995 RepID=UPI003F6A027D
MPGDQLLIVIATSVAMTNPNTQGAPQPDPALAPVPSDHAAMESEATYRELEQNYRHSVQYAWMQERYPRLRYWMQRCKPSDLVGGPTSQLQWERSHGDT